jgi:tetratricopeptide (TPR) repeat protein
MVPTFGPLRVLTLLLLSASTASLLDQAQQAIEHFRVERGLELLDRAKRDGPYRLEDHIRLYEQYALAHAYLDKRQEALRAFSMVLTLDPGHAIRYSLSPKVTLLFEEARRRARDEVALQIAVDLPRGRSVSQKLPIGVQVLADKRQILARVNLFWRRQGAQAYRQTTVPLLPPRNTGSVTLPALAPRATSGRSLELYLVGYDRSGNEVCRWHDSKRPRELSLSYTPPRRWYHKWWIWAIVGSAVAAGAGGAAFAIAHEPASRVDATAEIVR